MSYVIFDPAQARDSVKEFDGQVIAFEYSDKPFGIEGSEDIEKRGKQLCLKIQTDQYEKAQYIWLPPSQVKKTKWIEFLSALGNVGALAQITVVGTTDDEKINSFGTGLLGMKFHLEEKEFESLVKEKGASTGKKFRLTIPTKYIGKLPIQPIEVKQATISEELK